MRKILVYLCLVIATLASVLSASGQGEWAKLSPDGGRFSILIPGTPKEKVDTTPGSGPGPYTTHLFISNSEGVVYLAGWVDYDPSFNFGIQSEIDANRDNFLKGLKATLVSERKMDHKGNPGLEFIADMEGERSVTSRVFIVGRRPYQLVVIRKKGSDQASVDKFLSSFTLIAGKVHI